MKKLLCIALSAVMCLSMVPSAAFAETGTAEAGDIAINQENFPDEAFRQILMNEDYGEDQILTEEELAGITELDLSGFSQNNTEFQMKNLKGIEYFKKLEKIRICEHSLKEADFRSNPDLKEIEISNGPLECINVTENRSLEHLYCSDNHLSTIDISQNPDLVTLYCQGNNLKTLDISNNPALVYLQCYENNLESLNSESNPVLKSVSCARNNLQSLDFTHNPELHTMFCSENHIESLDISNNPDLMVLRCSDNMLRNLDVSSNAILQTLNCERNLLSTIDLSENKKMKVLSCGGKNFRSVNFTENPDLRQLDISDSPIEDLDIKKNDKLGNLSITNCKSLSADKIFKENLSVFTCIENDLSSIDLSMCKNLRELNLPENNLTELNIENNGELRYLDVSHNKLENLDISKNEFLRTLHCEYNNLKALDISNNTELHSVWAQCNQIDKIESSDPDADVYCAPEEIKMDVREGFDYTKVPTMDEFIEEFCEDSEFSTENLEIDRENKTISLVEGADTGKIIFSSDDDRLEHLFYFGNKKDLSDCDISLNRHFTKVNNNTYKYASDGKQVHAKPVVKDKNGNVLKEGKDYTVEYDFAKRVNPGKYTITVEGKGLCTGKEQLTLIITPEPVKNVKARLSTAKGGYDDAYLTWNKAVKATGYQVYARRPSKTSKWTSLGRTAKNSFLKKDLKDGYRYEFKVIPYVTRDDIRYRTTGDYKKVSLTALKKVKKPSVKKYSSSRVKVSWKDISGESGYQVRAYRSGKTSYFRTSGKTLKLKVAENRKYTYKVRAYKNVKKNDKTVRVYGPWSDSKTYTLK